MTEAQANSLTAGKTIVDTFSGERLKLVTVCDRLIVCEVRDGLYRTIFRDELVHIRYDIHKEASRTTTQNPPIHDMGQ